MDASWSPKPDVARSRSLATAVYEWVDERLGLEEILALARKKTVPDHKHSFWYYWGGISLFFFFVQVFSGVLLLVYYRPGAEAYESVPPDYLRHPVRVAHPLGALVVGEPHGVCRLRAHVFGLFHEAYRKPREFGWWSGMALLALTLLFGFSGYLLPMDDLAYFATKVGLEIPAALPLVGTFLTDIVRGGPEVSETTIQRFFALHVVILPLIYLPILAFHLWLVQKHGNALPPSEEAKPESERRTIPFFPDFFSLDLGMWLIALNVLSILASLYPWQLGPQADPLAPAPVGIHPEWYFMSQFQVLKVFGRWFPGAAGEALGISLFTLAIVIWAAIPLFDTRTAGGRRAQMATYFGYFALLGMIVFSIWATLDLK
jgi:quinol-cytochrome oxidoreductase complex cytochrome b subunit